ncbi:MAG: protein kinase [Chloroflexota bacterium]|nr:protein kinase [Chloroflexota bacterium]
MKTEYSHTVVAGRYGSLRKIGQSHTTDIFRALDSRLGRVVALRILRKSYGESPVLAKQFEDEARAMASVTHPNVVRVYDYDWEDGRGFMVMEFVHGHTLTAYLSGLAASSEEETKQLAVQSLEGLSAVCRAGITHTCVAPEHILVNGAGALKIAGLGLGKPAEAGRVGEMGMSPSHCPYLTPQATPGLGPHVVGLKMSRLLSGTLPREPDHWLEAAATVPDVVERTSLKEAEEQRPSDRCVDDAVEDRYRGSERVAVRGAGASDPTIAIPVVNASSPEGDTIWFPTIRATGAGRATPMSLRSGIPSLFSFRPHYRVRVPARGYDRGRHDSCPQGRPHASQHQALI